MRIKTQFMITMLLFAVVLVIISASIIITNQQVEKANEQETIASNIAQGAGELSYLSNDYVIYRENQQLERWQSRFATFSSDVASLQALNPEQQTLVDNIQSNTQRMKTVFDSVVLAIQGLPDGGLDPALLQVSWSRMAVQSQGLVSDASLLSHLFHLQTEQLKQTNLIIIFSMMGLFIVYFLTNSLMIQRRVLKSIARLRTGTAVIGSGNLNYRIEEKKNDEVGDLSRAFNRMTANLKDVTSSKNELEREIEERKKAEEALLKAHDELELHVRERTGELNAERQRFSDVLNMLPAYLVLLTPDYHVPFANKFFRERFGESRGRRCFEYLFNRTEPCETCETYTVMKTNAPHHWEWTGPDGHNYDIFDFPFTDSDGSNLIMEMGIDITEQKKAQEALRKAHSELEMRVMERTRELSETRDYLDNLFNYANAPIIVWDPEFRITRFNHAFERLTGLKEDEVLGKPIDILLPEDKKKELLAPIRSTTGGERWEVVEIPILRVDGTIRTVLWNSASIYMPDRKVAIATIAQGQDITGRKLAEEEIKSLNEDLARRAAELEAANKELEAFSYSVSHDLRAPLRSMEGFSSALLEDYAEKLDAQGKQYLRYIQESSDLMARLIDDMLKLSRVTRSDMSYEKVDLCEVAWNIMGGLEKAEPQRKVKVTIAPDITAYGDRNLLRLVLENFLGNAWKFSSKVSEPRIEMGTVEHNGKQAYFVRDNGVGFDMSYADKLFKPFQRLHKASEFSGTGIGLATVQRIIHRHGGEVWAESKVGEGATFYFTLE